MEVSLRSTEDSDFSDSEKAIFNVLKATLQYPADAQLKGIKLASDVKFFYKSTNLQSNNSEILWDVWAVILDIVYCVPPGHPWQTSLIQSLDNLRKLESSILEHGDERDVSNIHPIKDLELIKF